MSTRLSTISNTTIFISASFQKMALRVFLYDYLEAAVNMKIEICIYHPPTAMNFRSSSNLAKFSPLTGTSPIGDEITL